VKSISNEIKDKELKITYEDRNKYSIFISVSTGCQFNCQFCYLTMKKSIYKKLSKTQIIKNIKEALEVEIKHKPELKNKYVKLSWMGMGDAFNQSEMVKEITIELLDWIIENKYAKGLDGVDLSTIFPKTKENWQKNFKELENQLSKYTLNPKSFIKDNEDKEYTNKNTYKYKRSKFRLFYSLGSANQEKKETIIPNVEKTETALEQLINYSENNKYNIIMHHMFIEELNANEKEINEFIKLIKKTKINKYEIRILRYNFCDASSYKESDYFYKIIEKIQPFIEILKVQISAGNEVKAACGQFLVKKWKK
jgi:adenine C2-methylase RlmN of 23S rRNA A2503 and tRNA A37